MVYSKAIICNMALAHVGVTARIQDVDNENSNEAINCRLFYDHIVDLLLETCLWPFAERDFTLADVGSPPPEWAKRYKYPVDCKYAAFIKNPALRTPGTDGKIPFIVKDLHDGYGKCILTDLEDAILVGNYIVTDPNKFSSSFVQAGAMGLASHVAMPLRVDANITKFVQAQFTNWLAEAVNFKQREQRDDPEPNSEMQTVRG